MRLWLAAAVAFLALCASLGYWVDSGGFDCRFNCSTAQKITGFLVYPLALIFVVLVIAGVVRAATQRRTGRAV